MKQNRHSQAFTLVELLVVIAIIAILIGLLQPAIFKAMEKGKITSAQVEAKSIEAAVKSYLNEYSKLPARNPNADYAYGKAPEASEENKILLNTLRSVSDTGNTGYTNNPRKIVFLDVSTNRLIDPVTSAYDGNYRDPWKQQYEIMLDTTYDSSVSNSAFTYKYIQGRNVAVWSRGPDTKENTSDDVKTW